MTLILYFESVSNVICVVSNTSTDETSFKVVQKYVIVEVHIPYTLKKFALVETLLCSHIFLYLDYGLWHWIFMSLCIFGCDTEVLKSLKRFEPQTKISFAYCRYDQLIYLRNCHPLVRRKKLFTTTKCVSKVVSNITSTDFLK